jgi:diguanylate cyclase (GGDEF)-like protein/PAS domain S-box-containing protein
MSIKKQTRPLRRAVRAPVRTPVRNTATHAAASSTLTEKRYHELFDALAEGVVMIGADGHVIAANASAEVLLGMTTREIERTLRNDAAWHAIREDGTALPPRDFPVRKTLRSGKATKNVMVGIRLPRRKLRWLSVNTQPLFAPGQRKPIAVVASFEDITQQRRVEAEHAQLAAAFNASADAITSVNRDSKFVSWNPGAEKLFGYSAREAIGRTTGWMIPEHLRTEMLDYRKRVLAGETVLGWATQRTRKDGTIIPVESSYAPIRDARGNINGIVGVHRDVSQLQAMLATIKANEQLFRLALNGIPDAFMIYDAELRLKFVNVRAAGYFGKPYYELLGRCDDDLLPVEVTSRYLPALLSARSTKSTQSAEATFALRGRQLSINATYVPMLDDAGAIGQILGILHDFTKRRQTEERMAFMAQYDALTGLPNRYLLLDRMEAAMQRAKRNNSLLGVLFLDLDRFKQVNDTHGHAIGDLLLQQVAERLAGVVRATDTIARLGGDEFTVLLENTTSVEEITAIAEKIKGAFALPFDTAAGEIFTTTSVGITIYPHDDHDRDELLKNADIAMYQAKQERNAWQLYRPDMNSNSAGRLSMEVELRHALEREEFELHFQPQLRIADGALIGVEALLRWNNGKLGRVPPGDFIPLAEDSGLIVPIGEWILRNACEHCKAWERAGLPPVPVSVNIAAPQFRRSNLLQLIGTVLSDCQLDPRWLTLEITESSIMKHAEQTIKTLAGLREMGIMLAIDDFGTGYSSLSYLKRFPVNKLKIDQSFVRDITVDPNDAAIVSAIIAMSKQLGLSTMAEGVETAAQLAFLTRLDCDEYQGYLIGKPIPAAEIPALFRAHHAQRR